MKKIFYATITMVLVSVVAFGQTPATKKMSNKELVKKALTEVFVKGNVSAIN